MTAHAFTDSVPEAFEDENPYAREARALASAFPNRANVYATLALAYETREARYLADERAHETHIAQNDIAQELAEIRVRRR